MGTRKEQARAEEAFEDVVRVRSAWLESLLDTLVEDGRAGFGVSIPDLETRETSLARSAARQSRLAVGTLGHEDRGKKRGTSTRAEVVNEPIYEGRVIPDAKPKISLSEDLRIALVILFDDQFKWQVGYKAKVGYKAQGSKELVELFCGSEEYQSLYSLLCLRASEIKTGYDMVAVAGGSRPVMVKLKKRHDGIFQFSDEKWGIPFRRPVYIDLSKSELWQGSRTEGKIINFDFPRTDDYKSDMESDVINKKNTAKTEFDEKTENTIPPELQRSWADVEAPVRKNKKTITLSMYAPWKVALDHAAKLDGVSVGAITEAAVKEKLAREHPELAQAAERASDEMPKGKQGRHRTAQTGGDLNVPEHD
ncbi:MAG: hypothetical protein AAFV45_14965 [Pseudomonadota bacterium]